MLGLIFLLIAWATFPEWPVFCAVALALAVWRARSWTATGEDTVAALFVWGALIGWGWILLSGA